MVLFPLLPGAAGEFLDIPVERLRRKLQALDGCQVAAILAGKLDDVGSQCYLVIGCRWNLALRRSMLT